MLPIVFAIFIKAYVTMFVSNSTFLHQILHKLISASSVIYKQPPRVVYHHLVLFCFIALHPLHYTQLIKSSTTMIYSNNKLGLGQFSILYMHNNNTPISLRIYNLFDFSNASKLEGLPLSIYLFQVRVHTIWGGGGGDWCGYGRG